MTDGPGQADSLHKRRAPALPARSRRAGSAAPGRVGISLSDGFRLVLDDHEIELPGGAQRLVALLALRGRIGRSSLAGTLWPDAQEHRALARLRTAIWRVNQAVPLLVVSSGSHVDLGAHAKIDVRDQIGRSLEVLHGKAVEVESWAANVPAGDLLPDWEDEWLVDDRERLRQLRLHVLEDISGQLCQRGQFGLAIDTALAVLRADVLRESAHRALLRAHLAEGNLAEARRAYRACEEIFERELGVRPSPATTALLGTGTPVVAAPRSRLVAMQNRSALR